MEARNFLLSKKIQIHFMDLISRFINFVGLVVKIEEDGEICEIPFHEQLFSFNFNHLLKKNIRDLYILPTEKSLTKLAMTLIQQEDTFINEAYFDPKFCYPSRNLYEDLDTFFEFYSDIPFSRLYLWHMDGYGILGVIEFNEFFRRSVYYKPYPLIILDQQSKIKGFNEKFLNLFPTRPQFPQTLLSQNIETFIRPNPLDIIRGHGLDSTVEQHEKGIDVFTIDFSRATSEEISVNLIMTDLSTFAGGWRWTPQEKQQGLLSFVKPLNFNELDCRISIQLKESEGTFPSMILGGSQWDKKLFPDYKGYLVGFDSAEQQYIVKKEGERVHVVAGAFPADKKKHHIEIVKRYDHLLLWVDNTLMIRYRDPDFKENPEVFLYLYSDTAGKGIITLDSLQLTVFPRKRRLELPINRCVMHQNGVDTTVEFTQLADSRIARIYSRFYYVFVLHDVSSFTQSIKSLKDEREKAFLERNKFKALAMQGNIEQAEMVGESLKLTGIKENAKIAAASSVTVLIEGKTGTGKEVLAHFIHKHSLNSQGPFVKVDCSSLPGSLLESELFGFEKGAFTGADHSRKGKLEEAEGGTLFLDEIGNLSANAQIKLLNFLQDFTLEHIGSNKKVMVHTRIIAATNETLSELVKQGKFRADLMYRLNIVNFQLPMLQERKEDIPYLCTHFLQIFNRQFNRSIKGFTAESFQKLIEYDWPGNIRELGNVIQRAVLYCEKKMIDKGHLSFMSERALPTHEPLTLIIPKGNSRLLKREHIVLLLKKNNGVAKYAASEAGISRATLFRKIKKYKITKAECF
ncbi:MAG: hypothetical protein A2293_09835 [Elusimicrobia bacterium RIFOXYB2_FULL_49_7]|nr:MAG: hypothetical protein A2293_09835 [Elusimicrobia bacterium RIFOXYB2_FULL_49_7]